ncbi:hypothetical protein SYNTR_1517 [Candidatus Syntrophocurvum alkaliphilum]|uniref:SAF domain-containing protein n=1 Tax=Candidatus Syntrophocurvum alkaliphilum TaxID=2293317 RepID=A0A6I6DIQ9_9FIRM|nr:Flp pilus assembly protein CpaB [Candidatus Syntrophocurvum alkaliphilum]QGU00111.1 hypothetical protein SYNTR_1517 [Candidatus Syntrophocurvum alkaliphilum]
MLKGSKKYWIIAAVCGFLAAILTYQYIQEVKVRYEPDDLIDVVTAVENIEKDTVINSSQVTVEQVPAKFTHSDVVADKDSVVGMIAVNDIFTGEHVLSGKLLSSTDKVDRLSYTVPESKRAVSIPINSISGVSGFIRPGDSVDILATVDIEPTTYSVFTLQDIEVLATGIDGSQGSEETITLAVLPTDAQQLVIASERGSLRLLLRSPVDDSTVTLPAFELEELLN